MSENPTLYLIRHGETEWSRSGRHTGVTDVELTRHGMEQARRLRSGLSHLDPTRVLSSPRRRATDTARLAGFGGELEMDDRLAEWTYGAAEGRTTLEIREEIPGWTVWNQPLAGAESVAAVGVRVDGLIDELRRERGVVLVFGHSHLSRIFAARWCGWPPEAAEHLLLNPAGVGILGYHRETAAIVEWNRSI